jgi:hypothetical protein
VVLEALWLVLMDSRRLYKKFCAWRLIGGRCDQNGVDDCFIVQRTGQSKFEILGVRLQFLCVRSCAR